MVLTDSHGISRAPCYLGYTPRGETISDTGLSPTPVRRSKRFSYSSTLTSKDRQIFQACPTTPHVQPLPSITHAWFSLIQFRSPLLPESLLFSLPVGTEMFHFPTFPPHRLYIHRAVTPHHWCWVSPFGHPRITARLTTPRGLSRPTTSFIGSWYQGIHRTP